MEEGQDEPSEKCGDLQAFGMGRSLNSWSAVHRQMLVGGKGV